VWLLVSGVPENTLSETPSIERDTVQLDIYTAGEAECKAVALACRDQLEIVTHMTAWRSSGRDEETRRYRISMDFDWWLPR
jgi:hypothetical protein